MERVQWWTCASASTTSWPRHSRMSAASNTPAFFPQRYAAALFDDPTRMRAAGILTRLGIWGKEKTMAGAGMGNLHLLPSAALVELRKLLPDPRL